MRRKRFPSRPSPALALQASGNQLPNTVSGRCTRERNDTLDAYSDTARANTKTLCCLFATSRNDDARLVFRFSFLLLRVAFLVSRLVLNFESRIDQSREPVGFNTQNFNLGTAGI